MKSKLDIDIDHSLSTLSVAAGGNLRATASAIPVFPSTIPNKKMRIATNGSHTRTSQLQWKIRMADYPFDRQITNISRKTITITIMVSPFEPKLPFIVTAFPIRFEFLRSVF